MISWVIHKSKPWTLAWCICNLFINLILISLLLLFIYTWFRGHEWKGWHTTSWLFSFFTFLCKFIFNSWCSRCHETKSRCSWWIVLLLGLIFNFLIFLIHYLWGFSQLSLINGIFWLINHILDDFLCLWSLRIVEFELFLLGLYNHFLVLAIIIEFIRLLFRIC